MDLYEAIFERRSIRKFEDTPIPQEVIEKIVNAASWAPSACNEQLWQFVTINKADFEKLLKNTCPSIHVLKPATTIFVLYDKNRNKSNYANVQSAAAAIQNLLLAAHAEGLGALWMGEFGNSDHIKKVLNIPDEYMIIAAVILGYPLEDYPPPRRRPLRKILQFYPDIKLSPFPNSEDPRDWTLKEIKEYVGYTVRAKSPSARSYPPPYEKEYYTEVHKIGKIKGKTLFIYPFRGNYPTDLLTHKKSHHVILGFSQDILEFVEFKRKARKSTSIFDYTIGMGELPFKSNSFDNVLCLKKLEGLPDQERTIEELERVLKKEGTLYLIYSNSSSIFYLIWRIYHVLKKRGLDITGPFKPISPLKIKHLLRGFSIIDNIGICFFPKSKTENYMNSSIIRYLYKTQLIKAKKKY